jgi:prepilin-type N-terminal cleavage/methylation domain-containing protein
MYRPTPERDGRFGFTLIELLIVVAIIAILAAIAIPNFLEAQTRSRVSRAKGDLRTYGLALDSYFVDHNKYAKDSSPTLDAEYVGQSNLGDINKANGVAQLTTPIAYLSTVLGDPFEPPAGGNNVPNSAYIVASGDWSYPAVVAGADSGSGNTITGGDNQDAFQTFVNHGAVECYAIISPGPDMRRNIQAYKCFPWRPESTSGPIPTNTWQDATKHSTEVSAGAPLLYLDYDPTNGTVSMGDVQRFGGDFMSGNWNRAYQNADLRGSGPSGPGA